MTPQEMLEKYEELIAQRDLMAAQMADLIDEATPQEIKQAIADIKDEFEPEIEMMDAAIKALGDELKAAVASTGQKVIGQRYQVIYVKSRPRWDTKLLDGFAAAHPEILAFRKGGKPSAQIRVRK